MKKAAKTLIAISALTLPVQAFAATFTNQFIQFELPPQWKCQLEGAEWVCQNADKAKRKDAIIVLAAKLKGDQDSLDQYLAHLKKTKSYTSVKGKPVRSESKYAKNVQINGHAWVDSLHLESEIPGFYTRYLATVKADIGVLVTYSISKAKYQDYLKDFEAMIKTLKVFRKAGTSINGSKNRSIFEGIDIPGKINRATVFPVDMNDTGEQPQQPAQNNNLIYLILAGAAAVAFIIWKKRRG